MDMKILLAIALLAFALSGCVSSQAPAPVQTCTYETAKQAALDFVTAEDTYAFDGIPETMKFVDCAPVKNLDNSWTFAYYFSSRHAGYGDRTGQVVAQVITRHLASITVIDCEVKGGRLDESATSGQYFDMLNETMRTISPSQCSSDLGDIFCGGIAAFPCPAGYECVLDGSYPDAGGHCRKINGC